MRITTLIILLAFLFSCRKEIFTDNSEARLSVFTDTVHFGTVFTTTGSVTKFFKIFNTNDKGINIGSIRLNGGDNSPFLINVNGTIGPIVNNLNLAANDSAYVFITVKIDPSSASQPFVVRDSIEIFYNGNSEIIQLQAYGQNAHIIRNHVITGNETWENDLPYLIMGGIEVAAGARLTIKKGCKVYAHADAPILVKGSLQVDGEDTAMVIFTSDRLDIPYKNLPSGWPGIVFSRESKDNQIRFAVIKNAYQGIQISEPSPNNNPKLVLSETVIDNAYDGGLLAVNSSINASNVLISNCTNNLALIGGGNYQFTHCTVAGYYNGYISHKFPVLQVRNYYQQNGTRFSNHLNAVFRNCIFWAEESPVEDEVVVSKEGNTAFSVVFDHILWKVKNQPEDATIYEAINDLSPDFETIDPEEHIFDFRLKENSPAINKGVATNVHLDLDGEMRPIGVPDLGCYEQ